MSVADSQAGTQAGRQIDSMTGGYLSEGLCGLWRAVERARCAAAGGVGVQC